MRDGPTALADPVYLAFPWDRFHKWHAGCKGASAAFLPGTSTRLGRNVDTTLLYRLVMNSQPDEHPPFASIDPKSQEGRIRAALRLAPGPLPQVTSVWLERYYEHLSLHLALPFAARYAGDLKPLGQPALPVTVISLFHPNQSANPLQTGLICQAVHGQQQFEIPLVDLETPDDSPNAQQIEDYWYWFWNWRFDPGI